MSIIGSARRRYYRTTRCADGANGRDTDLVVGNVESELRDTRSGRAVDRDTAQPAGRVDLHPGAVGEPLRRILAATDDESVIGQIAAR